MKLSCATRQSPISSWFVCHRNFVQNLCRHTRGPNECNVIPLLWLVRNLLTVPYLAVPLLISLVLFVCLSASRVPILLPRDSFNWSYNDQDQFKCTTSLRPSCLIVCAFLIIACRQAKSPGKLAYRGLAMFTLTATLLLLALCTRPVSAQTAAFLNADSMDSYEHEEEEDNEQTGTFGNVV